MKSMLVKADLHRLTEQERQALLRTLGGHRVKLVRQRVQITRQLRRLSSRLDTIRPPAQRHRAVGILASERVSGGDDLPQPQMARHWPQAGNACFPFVWPRQCERCGAAVFVDQILCLRCVAIPSPPGHGRAGESPTAAETVTAHPTRKGEVSRGVTAPRSRRSLLRVAPGGSGPFSLAMTCPSRRKQFRRGRW